MAHRRINRTDSNHADIVRYARRLGAKVIDTSSLANAFDILVYFRGKTFSIEIKSIEDVPKKFRTMSVEEKRTYLEKKLTDGEKRCKADLEQQDCIYSIVWDADSLVRAIGANKPKFK